MKSQSNSLWKDTINDGFIPVTNFTEVVQEKDEKSMKDYHGFDKTKFMRISKFESSAFGVGDTVFCKELNQYVEIKGIDDETKEYLVKISENSSTTEKQDEN